MKTSYTLEEQLELIKSVWRIILAASLIQLIGGFSAIFISKYGSFFVDLWFGGAVSSFPGFILGLLWHSSKKAIKDNLLVIGFLGFLSLMLTLSVFFMPLEEMALSFKQFPFPM